MTQAISPVVDQMSTALTLTQLRQQAIASNIANRDVPGYQRLPVSFPAALDLAVQHAQGQTSVAGGSVPSLESDMVAMSTNTLHYQALVRVLSRYLSIEQTVANGGRS
jgi:flagellar basal-body rod protein FlgB